MKNLPLNKTIIYNPKFLDYFMMLFDIPLVYIMLNTYLKNEQQETRDYYRKKKSHKHLSTLDYDTIDCW